MLSFMLQEGVLTIGTVSGIFTALLMNSFKNNIIDPVVEKIAPLDKLIDFIDDGKLNNSAKKINTPQSTPQGTPQSTPQNEGTQGTQQGIIPSLQQQGNQFGGQGKDKIKWKVFLRDFITWLIIVFVLYIIWKKVLQPLKLKNNLTTPNTNTQFLPTMMNIGKGKK
jgi:large-conductance mechanosensitive channel